MENELNDLGIEWQCSRCGKIFVPTEKALNQNMNRGSQFVYCSRECLDKRKMHPIDNNLFFCFNCKKYKHKNEYYKNKSHKYGISVFCKTCHKKKQDQYFNENPERYRARRRESEKKRWHAMEEKVRHEIRRKQYQNNRENRVKSSVEFIRKRRISEPEWAKETRSKYKKRIVVDLRDTYIRDVLRLTGVDITTETIELKRQQIMAKRTLKQFKQWREENESNYKDVYGKQRPDEKNNERGISIKSSSGSTAGI